MRIMRTWVLGLIATVLVACAGQAPQPTLSTETDAVAVADSVAASRPQLVVMTHDSFAISEEVIVAFEQAHNAEVVILNAGDAGSTLNKAILTKDAPQADVLFGVDNTFLSRAVAADIFEAYAPTTQLIDAATQEQSAPLIPVDVGYVVINYDKAALEAAGLQPPQSLQELTEPAWQGKLVVENPATSSPGLAFLLATIAEFGPDGWQAYWQALRANDVLVAEDWTTAYYTHFSATGEGTRPLVVSYSTSPAAEVVFSATPIDTPPTGNVAFGAFRQVEYVGILRGTAQLALAQAFVDFMLSDTFQNDIPLQMFVYPASATATIPEVFVKHAPVPTITQQLDAQTIATNREAWLSEWDALMR